MTAQTKWGTALVWALAVCVIVACGAFDTVMLTEYYGEGPPYYGRTVNMDKWTSPVLPLVVVNGIGMATLVSLFVVSRSIRQRGTDT